MPDPVGELSQVVLMEVATERYNEVLRGILSDVQQIGSDMDGFLGVDIYGTNDRTHIMMILRWADRADWGKAQWDDRVQKAAVARVLAARHAEIRVYRKLDPNDVPKGEIPP